jgi:sugar lactone lactonase YvrE
MTLKRAGIAVAVAAVAGLAGYQSLSAGAGTADTPARPGVKMVPYFEWDETFPKMPLPNKYNTGTVVGVAVDKREHVWIAHRAETLRPDELEAERGRGECCVKGPYIMEFDYAGNFIQGWGGASKDGKFDWPTPGEQSKDPTGGGSPSGMHSVAVDDTDGSVWITATGNGDGQMLKFTRDGKFLMQVGHTGLKGPTSNHPQDMGRATGVQVFKGEAYVSDGYGNRRVLVVDAKTGAYKRHWGAFGNKPDDSTKTPPYDPNKPNQQFSTPHGIAVSEDGHVYLADRNNSRVQAFKVDGTFVGEQYIEPHSMSGTVFGVAISQKPEQKYLYIPDGRDEKVWILDRKSLEILGSFGCAGHAGGCMTTPHSIATDQRGNIYIGETWEGKRVQRFLYKGLRPQS